MTTMQTLATTVSMRTIMTFDRIRGLDFELAVRPECVGLDPRTATTSSPSPRRHLHKLFASMSIGESDRIIDVGCGKGSAIRTLRRFPFSEVSGIELGRPLADIAERNFRRLRDGRTTIYCGDAVEFDAYSRFTHIYMANPFPTSIVSLLLSALAQQRAPQPRLLIYANPVGHSTVLEAGFQQTAEIGWGHGNVLRIYREGAAPLGRPT